MSVGVQCERYTSPDGGDTLANVLARIAGHFGYYVDPDAFMSAAGYSESARSRLPDPLPLLGGHTTRSVGVSVCYTDFRPMRGRWMSEAAYRADLRRHDNLLNSLPLPPFLDSAAAHPDTVSSDSDDSDDSYQSSGRLAGRWDLDSDYDYGYEDIGYSS